MTLQILQLKSSSNLVSFHKVYPKTPSNYRVKVFLETKLRTAHFIFLYIAMLLKHVYLNPLQRINYLRNAKTLFSTFNVHNTFLVVPVLSMNVITSSLALCVLFLLSTNIHNPTYQPLAFDTLLLSHLGPSTYPTNLFLTNKEYLRK